MGRAASRAGTRNGLRMRPGLCSERGVKDQPCLTAERLVLRLLLPEDDVAVRDLASNDTIARMSISRRHRTPDDRRLLARSGLSLSVCGLSP